MIRRDRTLPDTRSETLNFNSDQSYSKRFQSPTSDTESSSHGQFDRERIFGWGWSDPSDQGLAIDDHYLNLQARQWQPYPDHGEQQRLHIQYQSSGAGQYPCQASDYPSYAFHGDEPSLDYAMSAVGYNSDTPSPSPMSPTAPHQQQRAPEGNYFCLVEGCNMTTVQAACMLRHVADVHFRPTAEHIDCQWRGCNRVGDYGFTRRDQMIEHMREVHHCDFARKSSTMSSARKDSAYSG